MIICDERGAELTEHLEIGLNAVRKIFIVVVNVWCQPTANIEKLVSVAEKKAKKIKDKCDYAYLFEGTHDMILKKNDLSEGSYNNIGVLVDTMFSKCENARHRLQKIAHRLVV